MCWSSPSAVVKPCGIAGTYGRGGKELVVNHDDHVPCKSTSTLHIETIFVCENNSQTMNYNFDLSRHSG